jgi:hypothetical protein
VIAAFILTPIASAVLAFAGAVLGQWWTRNSAKELDHWRRREETMRMVRWAVDLVVDEHPLKSEAGVATLAALAESELLQPEDKHLVRSLTDTLVENEVAVYDEGGPNAGDAEYREGR